MVHQKRTTRGQLWPKIVATPLAALMRNPFKRIPEIPDEPEIRSGRSTRMQIPCQVSEGASNPLTTFLNVSVGKTSYVLKQQFPGGIMQCKSRKVLLFLCFPEKRRFRQRENQFSSLVTVLISWCRVNSLTFAAAPRGSSDVQTEDSWMYRAIWRAWVATDA